MDAKESMRIFLDELGCRKARGLNDSMLLDGFSHEFYLRFNLEDDQDAPNTVGTVDIHVCRVGESPTTEDIRLVRNATRHKVMRFMFSLDVTKFSEQTRKKLYESNTVLRTQ